MILGIFTCNRKAAVPWGQLTSASKTWIDNWDEKILIKDPSKMVASEVASLYHYLLEKQSQGKTALEWIQAVEKDKRRISSFVKKDDKGKAKEVTFDSDNQNIADMEEDKEMLWRGNLNDDVEGDQEMPWEGNLNDEIDGDKEMPQEGSSNNNVEMDIDEVVGNTSTSSTKWIHKTTNGGDSIPAKKRQKVTVKVLRTPNTRYSAISKFN